MIFSALHLLKTAVEDGSCLVRTELVVALQHIVMAFERNFVNACRSFVDAEDKNVDATDNSSSASFTLNTLSPNNINQHQSNQHLKTPSPGPKRTPSSMHSSMSSPALDRMGIASNRSSGSLSSMGKLSSSLPSVGTTVYDKVYRAIEFLSTDPHHGVSGMAQALVVYLRQKVKSRDALSRPSLSIPAPLFNESLSAASTASEPSSPAAAAAKHSTPPPSSGSDGKPSVATIKEEDTASVVQPSTPDGNSGLRKRARTPNSSTHPRLAKGGSTGNGHWSLGKK